MNTGTSQKIDLTENNDELRPEYDFSTLTGGVQGKYYQAYRAGHTVTIHKIDGTIETQYFRLEDGAVMLEPDVRQYFPTSEAVNKALRCLIPLVAEHATLPVKAA